MHKKLTCILCVAFCVLCVAVRADAAKNRKSRLQNREISGLKKAILVCQPDEVKREIEHSRPADITEYLFLLLGQDNKCENESDGIAILTYLNPQEKEINTERNGMTPLMVLANKGDDRGYVVSPEDPLYQRNSTSYPFKNRMARKMLEYGSKPEKVSKKLEYDSFMLAAHTGNKGAFSVFVGSGNDMSRTLARTAAKSDYAAVSNLLKWGTNAQTLVKGKDVEEVVHTGGLLADSYYWPMILVGRSGHAAAADSVKTAQVLIKYGANLNNYNTNVGGPLCSALVAPDAGYTGEYVDFILSQPGFIRYPLSEQDPQGYNTVWSCAVDALRRTESAENLKWAYANINRLTQAGFDVNETGAIGFKNPQPVYPLMLVTWSGLSDLSGRLITLLLDQGAQTNEGIYKYYEKACQGGYYWCSSVLSKLRPASVPAGEMQSQRRTVSTASRTARTSSAGNTYERRTTRTLSAGNAHERKTTRTSSVGNAYERKMARASAGKQK